MLGRKLETGDRFIPAGYTSVTFSVTTSVTMDRVQSGGYKQTHDDLPGPVPISIFRKAPMGSMINVRSADDLDIPVYLAEPTSARKGAIVLIQEIFGVNRYIRATADGFAEEGYVVYAPDLYHRIEPGIEVGYEPTDIDRALELKGKAGWDLPLMDIISCIATLRASHSVGLVGYCYGGSLAWLTACRGYGMDASVCYYGGQIASFLEEQPKVPVQMHFGTEDTTIPPKDVEKIREFCTSADIHIYEGADHGFSCDLRSSFHPQSATLARERTLAFLGENMG